MTLIPHASIYDGLCSNIGDVLKRLIDDDTKLPPRSLFSRFTVKCQSMGTNTYIAIGSASSQSLRFTSAGQSMTFIAPILNGSIIPLDIFNVLVVGSTASGAGILEISGIRVYEI